MKIFKMLGLDFQIEKWGNENSLPLYLTNQFEFSKAKVSGVECLLIISKEKLPTIAALQKQINRIQQIEYLPVVLYLDTISKFRKENLIEYRIPFVVADKEVYLPFIATYLKDLKNDTMNINHFSFSTQLVFTWILNQNTEKYYLSELINIFPYSAMTLTRAFRQLASTGLFTLSKEGRNIFLTTSLDKKMLFEKSKPYLVNPICKSGYILKTDINKNMFYSGLTLLSELTDLNPPLVEEYGIYVDKANTLTIKDELIDSDKQVKIEVWSYNAQIILGNKLDLISLMINLLDNTDERVQGAIENLWNV